jgi:RND family efflux transporter MFP subunit
MLASAGGAVAVRARRARSEEHGAARRVALVESGPRVLVARVTQGPEAREVMLQGEARPLLSTTLYAKTSGYVREVLVDKGSRVGRGELLVRLDSPETEQAVAQAETHVQLRKQLAERARALSTHGVMSTQDLEQAEAALKTAQTELTRAHALRDYATIRAPFDGTITARYVDPGALVPAATGATQSAMPVVEIAKVDTLKALLYLGQDIAPFVRRGDDVVLWQDEQPHQRIHGKITLLAGQLDSRARTELAEVWFDNRALGMLPGTYVRVRVALRVPPTPTMAASAIVSRDGRLFAAVVHDTTVRLVPIEVGESDGRTSAVTAGLRGGELVVLDLPTELNDGDRVQPILRPPGP